MAETLQKRRDAVRIRLFVGGAIGAVLVAIVGWVLATVHAKGPPVIIHDGSVHVRVKNDAKAAGTDLSGEGLTVTVADLTKIGLKGYVPVPSSGSSSSSIPNVGLDWELDVCSTLPSPPPAPLVPCSTIAAGKQHGVTIKSASSGSGNAGSVQVKLILTNDLTASPTPAGDPSYTEYEDAPGIGIYGDSVTFTQNGTTSLYQCIHDDSDQTKCMIGIGKGKLTK